MRVQTIPEIRSGRVKFVPLQGTNDATQSPMASKHQLEPSPIRSGGGAKPIYTPTPLILDVPVSSWAINTTV